MSSPAVASYGIYESSSASTSHSANYPATVNSGDLLIAIVAMVDAGADPASSSGWTEPTNGSHQNDANPSVTVLWRKANGTEGGGNFTVSIGVSCSCCVLVYRITGAADPTSQPPVMASADVDGSSTAPSPPDSPTGSSDDYLGIAWFATPNNWGTPGGGDTDRQELSSSYSSGRVRLASSYNAFTGTGYTPTDYSCNSVAWTADTLLVYPAAGAAPNITGTPAAAAITTTGTVVLTDKLTGTPALAAVSVSATVDLVYKITGTPGLAAVSVSGALFAGQPISGTPSVAAITTAGTLVLTDAVTGNPSLAPVAVAATLALTLPITGTPSLAQIQAAGTLTSGQSPITGTPALAQIAVTGTLVLTLPITGTPSIGQILASGSLTGPAAVSVSTGAGRSRRRRRYVIEIDGQMFEVADSLEAEYLLRQARELAERKANIEVKRQVQKIRRRRKTDTAIRIELPEIRTTVPDLKPLVAKYRAEIEAIYRQAAEDAELRVLLRRKLRAEDEEEAIISLLLH